MTKNIRQEVSKARKNQGNIIILSMDYDKYNNAIEVILSKEEDKALALTRADQIGKDLLGNLQSSGARHFFGNAGDEKKLSIDQVRSKITQDIKTKINNKFQFSSSTRNKRKNEGYNRVILGQFIFQDLLPNYGWKVEIVHTELEDVPRATKGSLKLEGYEEMIDEAYLSGIYDTELVEGKAENGRDWLKKAGISLDDPYSIFSDELQQKRKRRKLNDTQTIPAESGSVQELSNGMYVYVVHLLFKLLSLHTDS